MWPLSIAVGQRHSVAREMKQVTILEMVVHSRLLIEKAIHALLNQGGNRE
jgi:hypothetical protein